MPRRVMEGRVVSDKTNKTITVLVERRIMDPVYKKFIRRSKKYSAHDEANAFRTGDFVAIEECPPISKSKRWKVITTPPSEAREDKAVVKALAARTAADLAKPEPKARTKKAEPAKPAKAKAAKPEAETKPVKAAKASPAKETKAAAPVKETKAKAEKAPAKTAAKADSKAPAKAAAKAPAKAASTKKKDDK